MENKKLEFKYNSLKILFEISEKNRIFLIYAGLEKGEKIIDEALTQFANIAECEYIGGKDNGPLGTRNNFSSYGQTYKYVSHESKENKLGLEVVIKTRNDLLEIDTHYQLYKSSKSISSFNVVRNISKADVKLTSVSSFYQYGILKANNLDNHLYIANNSWHREAQWQKFNFVDLGIYNGNEHASMGCYKYNVKDVKVGYPTSLSTDYKFDKKTCILEVNFKDDYNVVFLNLQSKLRNRI